MSEHPRRHPSPLVGEARRGGLQTACRWASPHPWPLPTRGRGRAACGDLRGALWRELRELNHQGFHFRQQAPIGPYIADFADHTAKLVIEVDGGRHGEPKGLKSDATRTRWLEANGYRVMRFWNTDVLRDPILVMDTIVRDLDRAPKEMNR